ncbi:MAG: bifunctional DNA-formamidopyrimidine glycosylase/DNA-(apurinic or apyrimidinic site) lyase [Bellilinea sp.]
MPELPEVETIVRALKAGGREGPPAVGRVLAGGQVLWERTLVTPLASQFSQRLRGQTLAEASRRGKFIQLSLTQDTLLIHLRMSGDLRVEPVTTDEGTPRPLATHDRLLLLFDDDIRLALNDPRKFGRVWLVTDPNEILSALGPEPLDSAFTAADLAVRLKGRQRAIKTLLLDQTVVAGLGNIYTDEALHLAKIHPLTPAAALTVLEIEHLWLSIRSVLQEGIQSNGASIDWVYRGGDFQNHFRAYGRKGQPCPVCGTLIERIIVGQRGTHFCPVCQPPQR